MIFLPLTHFPDGDESLTDLVTEGIKPTVFALYNAMVKQTVGSSEHHFVLEDLLSRVATQVQFSNLRQGLDENGKPLGQHGDTDYAYRVEVIADYLRLYANYVWVADSDNLTTIYLRAEWRNLHCSWLLTTIIR